MAYKTTTASSVLIGALLVGCAASKTADLYRINPGDSLRVLAVDTEHNLTVDARGYIAVPPLGDLRAAGRTPQELARLVSRDLNDPVVTITVFKATGDTSRLREVPGVDLPRPPGLDE